MADIVLKDRNGNDVTYEGIETVTFDTTAEGVQATFTEGVAVEDLEIVPDFSGGDMPIAAPEGTLVKSAIIKMPEDLTTENVRKGKEIGGVPGSFIGDTEEITVDLNMANGDQVIVPTADGKVITKVTVKKPENLKPENIPKDENIAGIIGTLVAGGPGKVAYGVFKPTVTQPNTITHDLGMLPDLVLVCIAPRSYPNKYYYELVFGVSAAFSTLNGKLYSGRLYYTNSEYGDTKRYNTGVFIEDATTSSNVGICNANETTFTIRTALDTAYNYFWLAIGGLT